MWRHFIPRALALISAITLGAAFVWYQASAARGPVQDDETPEAASQEPPQPAAYASPADASQTGAATGEGSHPFFPSSKALILAPQNAPWPLLTKDDNMQAEPPSAQEEDAAVPSQGAFNPSAFLNGRPVVVPHEKHYFSPSKSARIIQPYRDLQPPPTPADE